MENYAPGLNVSTSQNVAISYMPANVGERILAWLLDTLFILAYLFILFFLIFQFIHLPEEYGWLAMILFLPALFYHLILELIYEGRSFGKMILQIKVVKTDGSRPGFGAYALRWLFGLLERTLPIGVIGLIVILVNGRGQRIGDLAAGTAVVSYKQKVSLADTVLSRQIHNYKVVYPQVAELSDKDFRIINDVFNTAMRTQNFEVINTLAARTSELLQIPLPANRIEFLRTIINDYNHYGFDY